MRKKKVVRAQRALSLSKPKVVSLSKLKKQADAVFSRWIRARDNWTCITCGRVADQNGHFVSRVYLSLRYDEKNCHAQCCSCNIFRKGAMDVYAVKLMHKYGPGILEELQREKRRFVRYYRQDYVNIIEKYGGVH